MLLSELAQKLACPLEGDGAVEIRRVSTLEDAQPGDLSFLSNAKYGKFVASTKASAIIAPAALVAAPCAIVRSKNPYVTFADALAILNPQPAPPAGIDPLASVDPGATLGEDVSVGPFVRIEAGASIGARTVIKAHAIIARDATIGEDGLIHSHVSIREGVTIGHRVVLQDHAVIGSDGFGFARRADGTHQKIPQVGTVVIEDDVEIGSHSAVDRPAVGETRISAGSKLDNLVQIAHGVKLGRRVLLAAQVGLAGSTILEDDVIFAGQAGATGHLRVGKGVMVAAKGGVTHDIEPGIQVSGFPAFEISAWRRAMAAFRRVGLKGGSSKKSVT